MLSFFMSQLPNLKITHFSRRRKCLINLIHYVYDIQVDSVYTKLIYKLETFLLSTLRKSPICTMCLSLCTLTCQVRLCQVIKAVFLSFLK